MKNILVTGGAGFAGHHLIEHILDSTDDKVIVLDSLSYAGRVDRLTDIEGYNPDRVDIVWHDLRAPIPKYLSDRFIQVTDVLHLAAESHVDRSIDDPVPFVQNNVNATLNLLEWARNSNIEHFVQISTDEVYGSAPSGHAHKEWIDPMLPSNPYAASKVAQEAIAISYWRTYGVPLTITNTMNLIGERQHPEKFLPKTIRSISLGENVVLHGKYENNVWIPSQRHWLHARNHADALMWILYNTTPVQYEQKDETVVPNRWHVAGEEYTVLEVAELVADVLGEEYSLTIDWVDYHSSRPGHDHRYALDSSKIHAAGWKPPLSFEETIEKTTNWMMKNKFWIYSY